MSAGEEKISELPDVTEVTADAIVPIVQGGDTKKSGMQPFSDRMRGGFAVLPDSDVTLSFSDGNRFLLPEGTLSADWAATADPTDAPPGWEMTFVRRDTSLNTYTIVNGGPSGGEYDLPANTEIDIIYTPTTGDFGFGPTRAAS